MEGFNRQGLTVEELIANKQAEYAEDGIELTEEEAFEEVVAASMEGIMADGRVMELLQKIEAEDKSLGAKVRRFFQNIGQMIRDTIDSYKGAKPDSAEGRLLHRMEDIYSQLQEVFAEAVNDAGENFRQTENTTGEGGVRFCFGVTQETINNYIDAAYEKNNTKDIIKYAEVSDRLLVEVAQELDVTGYVHALRDNDIRHIRNSHGEGTNEKYPVTKKDLAKIPDIVENFDKIFVKTNSRGKPGIVYVKVGASDVVYYVEAVTKEYHNEKLLVNKQMIKTGIDEIPNLYGLIAAINKKESSSQYLADLQRIRKAYVQDVKENRSSSKVSYFGAGVNEKSMTDSDGNQLSDGQQAYFSDSVARDADGNLLVLYHQTGEVFFTFDPRKPGAGSSDNETPYGIFLKRSSKDIGLRGKRQMPLYANIKNPLRAENREDLVAQLKQLAKEYAAVLSEIQVLNDEYNSRFGAAKKEFVEYLSEWREKNPGASRMDIYQDSRFNELYEAEDTVIKEWKAKADALSLKAKETITAALSDAGYDGIFLAKDRGSFGKETDAIIALHPNQVKSVDNKNPTSGTDIRYAVGSKMDKTVQGMLEKENARLREDVAQLKELLKLQGKQTHGTKFTASSVEATARYLKRNAGHQG